MHVFFIEKQNAVSARRQDGSWCQGDLGTWQMPCSQNKSSSLPAQTFAAQLFVINIPLRSVAAAKTEVVAATGGWFLHCYFYCCFFFLSVPCFGILGYFPPPSRLSPARLFFFKCFSSLLWGFTFSGLFTAPDIFRFNFRFHVILQVPSSSGNGVSWLTLKINIL